MEYYFRANNDLEGYDLIKADAIQTSDDEKLIGEIVATVYDVGSFGEFIKHCIKKKEETECK